MLPIATDENFSGRILRGVRHLMPHLDALRVQDTEMYKSPDPGFLNGV